MTTSTSYHTTPTLIITKCTTSISFTGKTIRLQYGTLPNTYDSDFNFVHHPNHTTSIFYTTNKDNTPSTRTTKTIRFQFGILPEYDFKFKRYHDDTIYRFNFVIYKNHKTSTSYTTKMKQLQYSKPSQLYHLLHTTSAIYNNYTATQLSINI